MRTLDRIDCDTPELDKASLLFNGNQIVAPGSSTKIALLPISADAISGKLECLVAFSDRGVDSPWVAVARGEEPLIVTLQGKIEIQVKD
jgi:hypothetical protein